MQETKRILIVDDEEINLEFFEVMLANLGFDVIKATNGLEALETVRKRKPDLIVLDNIMPKLTGWEVTRILKTDPEYAEYSDIPIIMFSALDDVKDKVEGLELGAEDYITKPFNFSEVLARIRAVLRNHELVRQIERRDLRLDKTDEMLEELDEGARELADQLLALREGPPDAVRTEKALGKLDALRLCIASYKAETERLKTEETALEALKYGVRKGTA